MAKEETVSRDLLIESPRQSIRFSSGRLIFSALTAFLLFLGFGYALIELFGLSAERIGALVCGAVAVVTIAGCTLLCDRGVVERNGYLVATGVLIVFCIVFSGMLSDGGAQALNSFFDALGSHTGRFPLPYETGSTSHLILFSAVVSCVLSAICAQIALRGNVGIGILLALAVSVAIGLGFISVSVWTLLLFVGIIATICINTGLLNTYLDARVLLGSVLAVFLVVALAAMGTALILRSETVDTSTARSAVRQAVYSLVYGGADYAMPEGELHNLGSLRSSERKALTVSTDISAKEYLRGFVGERYEGDRWISLEDETVRSNRDLFYWLEEDGFDTFSQIEGAASSIAFEDTDFGQMSIRYQGARGDYAYLPYAYAAGADLVTTTDQAKVMRADTGKEESVFDADGRLLRKSYLIQEELARASEQPEGDAKEYLDDESAYRDFVYDNYLSIPRSVNSAFDDLYGDAVRLSSEEAKARVLDRLLKTATYDAEYATYNDDTDFIVHFLTESKTGYSVHYASAATLLMRYYGIPARYVEGYVLDTATGDGEEERDIAITEKDAHAWVEYYLDGVGWLPFEVTPGYVDYDFYEVTDNTSEQYLGNAWNVTDSESESSWSPQVVEDAPDESEEESVLDRVVSGYTWLWILLALLGLLLSVLIIRSVIRRRRLARFLSRLQSDDARTALPLYFAYGLYLAEKCFGCEFDNKPFRKQGGYAEEMKVCSAETFVKAADVNARALFGREALEDTDRAAVIYFVGEIKTNVKTEANPLKRFYWKWIRCIY